MNNFEYEKNTDGLDIIYEYFLYIKKHYFTIKSYTDNPFDSIGIDITKPYTYHNDLNKHRLYTNMTSLNLIRQEWIGSDFYKVFFTEYGITFMEEYHAFKIL